MDVSFHHQRGVTLIEVLVAIFVFSIGLLGVGALSVASLSANSDALWRTRAAILASDLAERIRANSAGGATYQTSDAAVTGVDGGCTQVSATLPTTCTPAALALDDLFRWSESLSSPTAGLPSPTGSIGISNATSPPTFTVTVQWGENSETVAVIFQ